jgi:NADH-quinone oxidoreductase subunit L
MEQKELYLWLIPLLPLVGFAINGLLGKRFSKGLVATVALVFTAAAFAQALWIASQFGSLTLPYIANYAPWIKINGFQANFGFYLDQLSLVMLLVVTGVGFLIHVYSVGYMADDPGYYRFFAYLNLFMFFMLVLVLANNYLLMFVGWEGVGLASYLLIGFFFLKHSAAQAGKKAFITNRVGDFGFLIGMFLLIKNFGSLDFTTVFNAILSSPARYPIETAGVGLMTWVAFCLLFGATGKSAQLPLYVWLPDAMEGPTPVSALIHAATMVTAGVYMIARSHVIFNLAPSALLAVAIVGALTAFFAASIGMTQFDIKRVLAYSTISQLGYMFLACGVAAYSAGIFHLMTHAFFKALLFLGAGSVIHALSGEQDMRHMGGLRKLIPWTFGVMAVATLAISGIWPFAGFFSKDEILWKAFSSGPRGWIFWLIGIVTALMTSFYMFRLLFMTFFGPRRGPVETANEEPADHRTPSEHPHADELPVPAAAQRAGHIAAHGPASTAHAHGVHESPWVMLTPLVILAVLSTVGGWIGVPQALGGINRFEHFLDPVFEHHAPVVSMHVPSAAPAGTVAQGEQNAATTPATPSGEWTGAHEPASGEGAGEQVGTERALTGVSLGIALLGLFLAYWLYVARPDLPGKMAQKLGGIYETVLNKYYVDEAYYATFVDPIVDGSRMLLWRGMDVGIIDGTVNGAATTAKSLSSFLRRMQSGNIRSYAGWVALGAVAMLAYFIWMGVR